MDGIATQCGMARQAAGGGGLPARDDVVRNNIFADYTNGIQTVSASSERGDLSPPRVAWKCLDGITNIDSEIWQAESTEMPQWLKIDFGEAQTIYSVRHLSIGRYPVDYEIQSSDDNNTWTTRHSVDGNSTSEIWVEDVLDIPAIARYWRFNVSLVSSLSQLRIYEMEFRS